MMNQEKKVNIIDFRAKTNYKRMIFNIFQDIFGIFQDIFDIFQDIFGQIFSNITNTN